MTQTIKSRTPKRKGKPCARLGTESSRSRQVGSLGNTGTHIYPNLNHSKFFLKKCYIFLSFDEKDGSENKLDGDHMADLQASHFGFTDLKKGVFTSDYEDRYRKAGGDPANMDKQRKEYL